MVAPADGGGEPRPVSAHVLLIGPDTDAARRVGEWLAAQQDLVLHVTHAASIEAGVTILADASVDALVLDLPIDGHSPLATCRLVRAAAPHVAIVLNTPAEHEGLAAEALREGAAQYVVTGQHSRELAQTVYYALLRARAETELREARQRYSSLLDVLDDGVASLDANGAFVDANAAMARMLGYDTPYDLQGISLRDVYVGPGAADTVLECLATSGTLPRAEAELLRRDGHRASVILRAHTHPPRGGQPAVCEIICTDISTERRLEQEGRQNEQLLIAGTLAAGAAVELQRLMSMVICAHDLLAEVIDQGHPRRPDLQHLRDTAAAAAARIEELLATNRRRAIRPVTLDARTLLARLQPMLEQTLGGEIAMHLPPADYASGQVSSAPGELDRVLLDLAAVARDLEPEGVLTIATSPVYLDATYAREHLALMPGHYVVFVITTSTQSLDTLTAPDWQAERPFSPAAAERHAAVELATAYRILNQNGGHFTLRRTPGAGTTFKMYLPRVDSPGRLGTILLVEDEPSIRSGGRQLLELLDYRVLEAADPHEAIWLASRFGGAIDLLIADVVLPGMSGREMAERLLAGQYVSRVLYMSGLLKETLVERSTLPPDAIFIEKPFTARELAERVAEVLGGHA
jgi:PAS domain S-box-containing protein